MSKNTRRVRRHRGAILLLGGCALGLGVLAGIGLAEIVTATGNRR